MSSTQRPLSERERIREDLVIAPRAYLRARILRKGDSVRITDTLGQQVADMILLSCRSNRDWLSCLNTKLLNRTDRITTGHVLYSKTSSPLATITNDTVGVHWFGGGFCSEETNRLRYGLEGTVNCKTNLAASLQDYVSHPLDLELDSCASLFMNIAVNANDGAMSIESAPSQAGDYIELRAEDDIVLAVSNCPADRNPCNGFEPTEIRVTILGS